MKKGKQKWLRLDGYDGWQYIIPEWDIEAHGHPKERDRSTNLAFLDCPCSPKLDLINKLIIHNSFQDMKRITESINKIINN